MIDPNNSDRVFLGSHWAGVAVVENGQVTIYDKDNSLLQPPSNGADNVTHVGGFAMDGAGNLWITNNQTDQSIVVWKADGEWEDFTALNSTLDVPPSLAMVIRLILTPSISLSSRSATVPVFSGLK